MTKVIHTHAVKEKSLAQIVAELKKRVTILEETVKKYEKEEKPNEVEVAEVTSIEEVGSVG